MERDGDPDAVSRGSVILGKAGEGVVTGEE